MTESADLVDSLFWSANCIPFDVAFSAEVAARAAPECERAEIMRGGAFLLVTSEVVVGPALDALEARVMARLGNLPHMTIRAAHAFADRAYGASVP